MTYHAVGKAASPLWVQPAHLEAQLRAFAEAGYRSRTLAELASCLADGRVPPKSLVLTFDDGYATVLSEALPRLRAYGFRATVFLISDHCGEDNHWPGQPASVPRARLLTWRESETLAGEGWELAAHGRSHRPLTTLSAAETAEEVLGSCRAIERRTGLVPRTFAYPYGAVDAAVVAVVREHVDAAVGTRLGLVGVQTDRYSLPRIDAFYLNRRSVRRLESGAFRFGLGLRQLVRAARRRLRPDWRPETLGGPADG